MGKAIGLSLIICGVYWWVISYLKLDVIFTKDVVVIMGSVSKFFGYLSISIDKMF